MGTTAQPMVKMIFGFQGYASDAVAYCCYRGHPGNLNKTLLENQECIKKNCRHLKKTQNEFWNSMASTVQVIRKILKRGNAGKTLTDLCIIKGIGPKTKEKLRQIGYWWVEDLYGSSYREVYRKYLRLTKKKSDVKVREALLLVKKEADRLGKAMEQQLPSKKREKAASSLKAGLSGKEKRYSKKSFPKKKKQKPRHSGLRFSNADHYDLWKLNYPPEKSYDRA